jgi:hypothetical protein
MKRGVLLRSPKRLLAVIPLALASGAHSHDRAPSQWSEAAVDDLHFIRATLRENHPGPVDRKNPDFRNWLVRGFQESLLLAERARSYAGYYFAIQKYVVGFQDGHLAALAEDPFDPNVKLKRQWPGFVIGLDHGLFKVVESPTGSPAEGAVLESCDGRSARALVDEIIRPYFPLWSIRGSQFESAPFLLIDEGNPFVRRPEVCTLRWGSRKHEVRLNWMPISNNELASRIGAAAQTVTATTGIRPFGTHGWWVRLASFDVNTDTSSQPLLKVISSLEADPVRFRDADILVFDVRGNRGGNSAFGRRIAAALWGDPFVNSVPTATAVDWRVSQLNLKQLEQSNLPAIEKQFGMDDPETKSYAKFVDNYRAALNNGALVYHEPIPKPEKSPPIPMRARVFLLTDGWCHSACLDFADIVLGAPGVTQVGAETSADTVYIDNTAELLPSGEGWLGWSTKVYRGRPRGYNQGYAPKYLWNGRMNDTPAIEKWI